VTQEMGDVFSYLFQLAGMLNIDLDHMWTLHREKVQGKIYKENVGVY
jgi:NTP pyrophosphatase (non-canonical NTP hydrolase)